MMDFPLILTDRIGDVGEFLVYLFIGVAFGAALEMSGFGNSKKLAAQFYFKEMTVLKVMFTAIVVAMVGIFFAWAVGWLDYERVWVNPTYLIPGIVGGFIMGVGFIIGGFCPGTSLVAAATLKLDGLFFVLGVLAGIFVFGESVAGIDDFWQSTDKGRYTLQAMLGVDAGVVVVGVVLMALVAFWLAEISERRFGDKETPLQFPRWRYAAAGALLAVGVAVLLLGEPAPEKTTALTFDTAQAEAALTAREVYVHPGEVLQVMHDKKFATRLVDVRSADDFAAFHLEDAENITLDKLPDYVDELKGVPSHTAIIVMGNDETAATAMWRALAAAAVPNIYILEGGLNHWIATFGDADFLAAHASLEGAADEQLGYTFETPLGEDSPLADPDPEDFSALQFVPKLKVQPKAASPSGGGCG